jgi:hypothetical protein
MKKCCRPSCRPLNSSLTTRSWEERSVFTVRLTPSLPPGLVMLKMNLLNHALRTYCEPHFKRPLRIAAERAARLAAETGFPLLMFPNLFMELAIPAMVETDYRLNGGFRFASNYQ